jgi:diaminohydroxyphosphoribosylaminopyrimidine deaminase/5-amino-6-(5-phosphoribosylamino)uracil reductase
MSPFNKIYMEKAFELAFTMLGKTSLNPSVGAVIVKNDVIVSTGGTCPYGHDHAEIVAIKNAKSDVKGSEMYVTLEPCCHYGKTPPCTESIINAGIARIYIPLLDPNPLVAGKGIMRLRDAGVDVVMVNEMADYASDFIRQFKKSVLRNRSYIIHKSAITLDGRTATRSGDSRWISSIHSRYIVHRLRGIVDAIIIGKGTLLRDNPTLNVRMDSFPDDVKADIAGLSAPLSGRDSIFLRLLLQSQLHSDSSPMRVILGLPDKLNLTDNVFFDDNYLFFVAGRERVGLQERSDCGVIEELIEGERIVFTEGDSKRDQIHHVLEELNRRGRMLVLLEGGATVAGSFFDAGEIDQFFYFISPRVVGSGLPPIAGEGFNTIRDSLALHDVTMVTIEEDILFNAYKEPYNFERM